jgi:transposase
MTRERRTFTAAQKAEIVRRYLVGKEPVSSLAEEFGVQPTMVYNWAKTVMDQADKAFQRGKAETRSQDARQRRIEHLEAKLVQKNEVIAELMEENVKAKKANGEL